MGLATLDVVHRVDAQPAANEKITAAAQFVAAGGPAANAAITFAGLGGAAVLITALGTDSVADLIRADLQRHGVSVVDVTPDARTPAPVSAVAVTIANGDRSVVSIDAAASEVAAPSDLRAQFRGADVVLIDGHHPRLAIAAAAAAQAEGVHVVVDAGRWKAVMVDIIPFATSMVCSDDFRHPEAGDSRGTAVILVEKGVPVVVTTHGHRPVQWWHGGASGSVEVPQIDAVDTLGAGDVFHGAYSYFSTFPQLDLATRLTQASRVAALRCSIIGPREWLSQLADLKSWS